MSSSRLGPQLRDMQNSGVPTKKAVGWPLAIDSFRVIWCMSQGGFRVQIGLTPRLSATVGVTLGIAGSPTTFVWAWALSWTWTTVVPTRCGAVVVSAMSDQIPDFGNGTTAALRPWGKGGPPSGWAYGYQGVAIGPT